MEPASFTEANIEIHHGLGTGQHRNCTAAARAKPVDRRFSHKFQARNRRNGRDNVGVA
jgi:hypothetical protein